MSEHRAPVLSALRRHEDPAHSSDPRIRAIVTDLADLSIAPEIRGDFRTDLRAQLVAIAPRLIADGADIGASASAKQSASTAKARATRGAQHAGGRAGRGMVGHRSFARPLTIAASVVAIVALLLGGATWMSRKSLPGDALYGLKRASENVQLAFDSNRTDEALDRLHFAETRVAEAQSLLGRSSAAALGSGPQASGVNEHTADLIESNLRSADGDVTAAWRQLAAEALSSKSTAPLATMIAWAPKQIARLGRLAAAMQSGSMRARALSSAAVVQQAWARATALQSRTDCSCMSGARSDRLGPVPCTRCPATTSAAPRPPPTSSPGVPVPATGSAHVPKVGPDPPTRSGTPGASGARGGPGVKPAPRQPPATKSLFPPPKLSLPALPHLKPPKRAASLPVKAPTCEVSVTTGPVGIQIGLCHSSGHS